MRRGGLFVAVLLLLVVPVLAVPAQELAERGMFKGHRFRIDRAALSPDGKVLAAGGGNANGGELRLWDVSAGKEITSLEGYTSSLFALAFSADGKRLASGSTAAVQVWDVNACKEVASFRTPEVWASAVAFNRDGTRLAAVSSRDVKLWEVASGKEFASFRLHVAVWSGAAFSRDLATLAAGNYQEIDLWDAATGKEKAILSEHRGEVGCMVWNADDKTLIASSTTYEGGRDVKWKGDVKLWNVGTGKERATLPGPFGRVLAMAPSSDGKILALLDWPELYAEADLKLVDVATGRQRLLQVPPGCSFLSLRFITEGKLQVTGVSVDALRLWEVLLPQSNVKWRPRE